MSRGAAREVDVKAELQECPSPSTVIVASASATILLPLEPLLLSALKLLEELSSRKEVKGR